MSRKRATVEVVLAVLAAVGCVLSWRSASRQVVVAPLLEGQPSTVSLVYDTSMLTLSLLLATVAGVLVVLAIARLRRRSPSPAE